MAASSDSQSQTTRHSPGPDLAASDSNPQPRRNRIEEEADQRFGAKRYKTDRYLSAKKELQAIFGEEDLW